MSYPESAHYAQVSHSASYYNLDFKQQEPPINGTKRRYPFQSSEPKAKKNSQFVDPDIITSVFICPLCKGKMVSERKVRLHLQNFHGK